MPVSLTGDLKRLHRDLRRLSITSLRPVANRIGEHLVSSTIRRFNEQRGPDGTPWPPLAASTVLGEIRRSDRTRKGALRKRSQARLMRRKILIRTARLRNSISYRVQGTEIAVGTNVIYGRIHQLGGEAGSKTRRVLIPARPFLGISDDDLRYVDRVLADLIRGRR